MVYNDSPQSFDEYMPEYRSRSQINNTTIDGEYFDSIHFMNANKVLGVLPLHNDRGEEIDQVLQFNTLAYPERLYPDWSRKALAIIKQVNEAGFPVVAQAYIAKLYEFTMYMIAIEKCNDIRMCSQLALATLCYDYDKETVEWK